MHLRYPKEIAISPQNHVYIIVEVCLHDVETKQMAVQVISNKTAMLFSLHFIGGCFLL